MKHSFIFLWLIFIFVAVGYGQNPEPEFTSGELLNMMSRRDPVKIINLGKKTVGVFIAVATYYQYEILYFENPDMVSVTSGFQLSGYLKKSKSSHIVNVYFSLISKGKKLTTPSFVPFYVYTFTKHDKCFYENNHNLFFGIGAPPGQFIEGKITKIKTNSIYKESCSQEFQGVIDYKLFKELALAEKATVKFGPDEVELNQKKDLRFIQTIDGFIGKY